MNYSTNHRLASVFFFCCSLVDWKFPKGTEAITVKRARKTAEGD